MLLHHLSAMHPTEVGPYLERMRMEAIVTVAAEAYKVVEADCPAPPGLGGYPVANRVIILFSSVRTEADPINSS